jgi:hypothetical protein
MSGMRRREFITLLGRRGGGVAANGTRAATNTDDWVPQQSFAGRVGGPGCSVPPRLGRSRICRGTESRDCIPLGRGSLRPIASTGG